MATFLIGPLYLPAGQYGLYKFMGVEEEEFKGLLFARPPAFSSVNLDTFEREHILEVFGYCPPQCPGPLKPLHEGDVIYCVRVAATKQRGGTWEDIWEYGRLEYRGLGPIWEGGQPVSL